MEIVDIIRSLQRSTRPQAQWHGPITSQIALQAPQLGATYRVKAPGARSINVTRRYARAGWYGSPYALQSSLKRKREHSALKAAKIGNLLWRSRNG